MSRLINYGIFASSKQRPTEDVTILPVPVNRWFIENAKLNSSNSAEISLTDTRGSALTPNGREFYVVGGNLGNTISQISFETGYDFTTKTGEKSLDVSELNTEIFGVEIRDDGTELFLMAADNRLYQYQLSTPWDITSGSYSFNYETGLTPGTRAVFSPDGKNFYSVDESTVYYYTTSTAWNEYGLNSPDSSFSLPACQGGADIVRSVCFGDNGKKMYVVTNSDMTVEGAIAANYIYQFALTTAWDPSSADYEGLYQDDASTGFIQDIHAEPDTGTNFVLLVGSQVVQLSFTLPENYDDPAVFTEFTETPIVESDNVLLTTSPVPPGLQGFEESNWSSFILSTKSVGTLLSYNKESSDNSTLRSTILPVPEQGAAILAKYGCSSEVKKGSFGTVNQETTLIENTPVPISGATYDNVSFSVGNQVSQPYGLKFSPDGTKMYVLNRSNDTVYEYTLSTGFDISTAAYNNVNLSIGAQNYTATALGLSRDGTRLFTAGYGNRTVNQFEMTTPFDLSTASFSGISFSVSGVENYPYDIEFNLDGTRMFITGEGAREITQWDLSAPYDISAPVQSGQSSGVLDYPFALAFSNDGFRAYTAAYFDDRVYQHDLTTAFDITTLSVGVSFYYRTQDGRVFGLAFSADGTKMFLAGDNNNAIFQYSVNGTINGDQLTTQWTADISSLGAETVPSIVCYDNLPTMSTLFLPSRDDILAAEPDSAIEHPAAGRREWIGDSVRSVYRKIIRPGNRAIQARAVLAPGASLNEVMYSLTKEPPGTRDTEGLVNPLIIEDFEDDVFKFDISSNFYEWTRSDVDAYEGSFSLASGNAGRRYTTSAVYITATLIEPAKLTFYWKLDAAYNSNIRIYVDNSQKLYNAGATDWEFFESEVLEPGEHTIQINRYRSWATGASDNAYIDQFTLNPYV